MSDSMDPLYSIWMQIKSDCLSIHFAKIDLWIQMVTAWVLYGRCAFSLPYLSLAVDNASGGYTFLSQTIFILFYIFPSLTHTSESYYRRHGELILDFFFGHILF